MSYAFVNGFSFKDHTTDSAGEKSFILDSDC